MSIFPIDPKKIPVTVFSTNSSGQIADGIFAYFKTIKKPKDKYFRGQTRVLRFSNENIEVQVKDNVRGHFAIIVHTQVIGNVNADLFELFALIDALMNSKVGGILVVFPYLPYVRSDRKNEPRKSTMAVTLARILNGMGVEHILMLDPHSEHVPHYFYPSANTITGLGFLSHWLRLQMRSEGMQLDDTVVVFADAGSGKRFEEFPIAHNLNVVYIAKSRNGAAEEVTAKKTKGDVADRHCIILDDEILTGNTVVKDCQLLQEAGAKSVTVMAVHGIFANSKLGSQRAVLEMLEGSPINKIVATNSTPWFENARDLTKFDCVDIQPLLAEAAIRSITTGSVSELMEIGKMPTVFKV